MTRSPWSRGERVEVEASAVCVAVPVLPGRHRNNGR